VSTITVVSVADAAGAVGYVLYGHDRERERVLLESGTTRAASLAMSMSNGGTTPAEFIARAERLARVNNREIQLYSYVQAFHPDEFDVNSQQDMDRIRDVAVKLTERMHSADYLIAVHADSAGGHGHAHILVMNHDNLTGKALQRYTSWRHGLHQLNDELMRDEGLNCLPNPMEPRPDWEERRFAFAEGGFERTLGDAIFTALADPRSVDRAAFEQVLGEHGITLAVTDRDGWSYKMRRADNGKLGRKKASTLTSEFTADGAQQIFDYQAKKEHIDGNPGHDQAERRGEAGYGDVGAVDVGAPRRRKTAHATDHSGESLEELHDGDGRGDVGATRSHVDLAAARASLDAVTRGRDDDPVARDREDPVRDRVDAHPITDSDAARRRERDAFRARFLRDDESDRDAARDDERSVG